MVYFLDQAPYYDDYDPNKHYLQTLAKPSFPEQAREFTQIQTTLLDQISRVSGVLLKAGDITDGMSVYVEGNGKVTVNEGKVYIEGLVLNFDKQSVTIPVTGASTVGVKVDYTIVTATEDHTLRDPAQGVTNQGAEGADRVKYNVRLVVDDPSAAPLYKFQDGKLVVDKERPDMTGMNEVLARRTYDESGNYKVRGLEVSLRNPSLYPTPDYEYVNLSDGKAYVKGFEVYKPVATTIELRKAADKVTTSNELKRYVQGVKSYLLNNSSVKAIKRVTMDINRVQDVTRSQNTVIDNLVSIDKSISMINKVWQDDTVYTYGVDYEISSTQSGINWSPTPPTGESPSSGKSPATGTTYKVDMVVLENIQSTTYGVETTDEGEMLVFTDEAPVPYYKPNSQFIGTFIVEYEFYYSRQDLIMVDKFGEIHILEGIPNIPSLIRPPVNQNENLLDLAIVTVSRSGVVEVFNIADTRTTMLELVRMASRLNTLELNQAITNLDRQAEQGEDATLLSGIYTDGFLNVQKADVYHPEFKCSIDLDNQEITTQSQSSVFELGINDEDSDVQYIGRVISAPFTHSVILNQSLASERMLVNPYAQFNAMGFVTIAPAVDTWIDEEMVTENKTVISNVTLRRWWEHKNASWAEAERQKWIDAGYADGGLSVGWDKYANGGASQSTTSQVIENLITYMRPREITVTGTNFTANANNITCYFNSIEVPVTATGLTQPGTKSGTIRSNANGEFTCTFTVPQNVLCGTVSVDFKNVENMGSASYTASGTTRTTTNTVLTTITNVSLVDPLAQSFQFTEDRILTKAGIYMAAKDSSMPLIIEIRNTVNGYPGQICYDRILVKPELIQLSDNGTVETVIEFNQPVYCEANTMYCIALLSDANTYQTFTATLGEKDLVSGSTIGSQPTNGTLFSSSNAQTWTAHQKSDLKFKLYEAVYNREGGIIIFDDVRTEEISRILLATDYMDKKNAGITWEFSVDDGQTWDSLENYSDVEMKYVGIKTVKLKALVKVDSNTSPLMAKDAISLVTFLNDVDMTYVGRNVKLDAPYTEVQIQIDTNTDKKEGISHQVFFAADGTGTHWIELTNPEKRPVNAEFDRYTYTYKVPGEEQYTNYRHKVHMVTKNSLIRPRASRLISIMRK